MYILPLNQWTELLLPIATGALCLVMSISFGAYHFRLPKQIPIVAAQSNVLNLAIVQPPSPVLNVTSLVQHGRILEITGNTEFGTVVMINGQSAATIFSGNTFKHFLGPLPPGTTVVSITCQNERGGVNTQQVAVTLK
jgi:hypothetical protein